MEKGTLYGVSIGPGDPELITVKAMKVIERSKYVATPETGTSDSLALSIVSNAVDLSAKEIMGLSLEWITLGIMRDMPSFTCSIMLVNPA